MSLTVKTPKGTELPLTNLKGKSYLMVAYRIQWFNEVIPNFNINTELIKAESDETISKATIQVMSEDGSRIVRSVTAHKREDSKGFPDHLEKAETGSVGRALLLLGYGTQFALADLDEGDRLADTPLGRPSHKIEVPIKFATNEVASPEKQAFKPIANKTSKGDL